MKVTFDTDSVRDYAFTHGKAPKGTGLWMFWLHRNGASTLVAAQGSFTDARKQAMREARSLGCDTVTLAS